jgi:hypothetical protein
MTPDPERPTPTWRVFVIPGVIALAGYILVYGCDNRLRTYRGPWEVAFLCDPDGTPRLAIHQPKLAIRDVTIRFTGERIEPGATSSLPAVVKFDRPRKPVPFGELIFDDLMYLPGTVVLHCFGHEVQMLPRALFLNRREHDWNESKSWDLQAHEKLPDPAVNSPATRDTGGRPPLPAPAEGPPLSPARGSADPPAADLH